MAWGWYTGASTDGTQIDIGGFPANPFEGTVEELSLNSNAQDQVLLLAQSQGNVCNSGEDDMFIDISGYDYREFIKLTFLIRSRLIVRSSKMRHEFSIKLRNKFRLTSSDMRVEIFLLIFCLENLEGDFAWSEWGSCSHNCNFGRSYRYRQNFNGEGQTQMYRDCNPQGRLKFLYNYIQIRSCQ